MSRKDKVLKAMKNANVTEYQLSNYCNSDLDKINKWLKGKIKLSYMELWKIADLLNMEVDEIM